MVINAIKITEESDMIGRNLENDFGYSDWLGVGGHIAEAEHFDFIPKWLEGVSHEMMGEGRDRKKGNRLWDDCGWVSKGQIMQSLQEVNLDLF